MAYAKVILKIYSFLNLCVTVHFQSSMFTGGSLKLKGTQKKQKKPKKNINTSAEQPVAPASSLDAHLDARQMQKTAAQLQFEKKQKERKNTTIDKLAEKSHKQRVEDYNKYLASLSEHHDIPRVGPG